jgi:hypothetical protein
MRKISYCEMEERLKMAWEAAVLPLNYARKRRPLSIKRRMQKYRGACVSRLRQTTCAGSSRTGYSASNR